MKFKQARLWNACTGTGTGDSTRGRAHSPRVFKQELVNGPFEHSAHWKILLSNILHTGRLSVFLVALSSCSTTVFHPCSAMGRGKQWSADTVREVKTLMNIGLPLLRIAAQTDVVLQTLRSFSARLKKGYIVRSTAITVVHARSRPTR